jgi:hypothetical protein
MEKEKANPKKGQQFAGKITISPSGESDTRSATLVIDGDHGQLVFRGLLIDGSRADINLGTEGQAGDLRILNHKGNTAIHLDGQAGDIILSNADFAEDFDIAPASEQSLAPGTVMVLDAAGKLTESERAYDRKVAGVISGAGNYRPGIIMDKDPEKENRLPIALVGKVYCKVDADFGPIESGDLLTTSGRPGHAMKATDPMRAFGSIIGKALTPLEKGQGMIPILVSLQ